MTMNIHDILKKLPHRYPFLMVDRVLELEHGKRIKALKNVTANEPYFLGHFPRRPVMPGVMMLEALAQAAALLSFDAMGAKAEDNTLYYFAGIDGARFKRPVEPGDQMILDVTLDRMKSNIFKFHARASVDGETRRRGGADVRGAVGRVARLWRASTRRRSSSPAPSWPATSSRRLQHRPRHVRIGAGSVVGPHCVIEGRTTIGRDNRISQFNAIGGVPQDKKYGGEDTTLEIGDRNTIREFCSIHIGTVQDAGVTRIGDDNWIMNHVHIAHDCQVGNQTIIAGYSGLAGHVQLGDWAIVGGQSGLLQFVRVGAHAMIGFQSHVSQDVPPFMMVDGHPLTVRGFNAEGMRRRGFSRRADRGRQADASPAVSGRADLRRRARQDRRARRGDAGSGRRRPPGRRLPRLGQARHRSLSLDPRG